MVGSPSPDDSVSRLTGMSFNAIDALNPADIVQYSYVGQGMTAITDYPTPDIQLDRTMHTNGTRNVTGEYPGWDHLGRVVRHAWVDGDLTAGTTVPTLPPILQEQYDYDRASNRIARYDARPGASLANRDFKFQYDKLDRLVEAQRGVYNPSTQGITLAAGSQQWVLDTLGNWAYFRTDLNGTSGYEASEEQGRTHNAANEISSTTRYAPGTSGLTIPFTYDDAGNMKDRLRSTNLYWRYTHDAWNRLVKVVSDSTGVFGSGATIVNESEYNGLHWRTVKRGDTTAVFNGRDQLRVMYYDASWRLLEERVDDNWTISSSTIDRHMQNVWGARYIDDLVARRKDANKDGDYTDGGDGTWYAVTDVQFSVVALLDNNGVLKERNIYDAYGTSRHRYSGDMDGDGDVDAADQSAINALAASTPDIEDGAYNVEADINRDGVVNSSDTALAVTRSALPSGYISDIAAADNIAGFDGYIYNLECELYSVRFRHYSPAMGRWMERDPIGYYDSPNLYIYGNSGPVLSVDSYGLASGPPTAATIGGPAGIIIIGGIVIIYQETKVLQQHIRFKGRDFTQAEVDQVLSSLSWAGKCDPALADILQTFAQKYRDIYVGVAGATSDDGMSADMDGWTQKRFIGKWRVYINEMVIERAIREERSAPDSISARLRLILTIAHELSHKTDNTSEKEAEQIELDILNRIERAIESGKCGDCAHDKKSNNNNIDHKERKRKWLESLDTERETAKRRLKELEDKE